MTEDQRNWLKKNPEYQQVHFLGPFSDHEWQDEKWLRANGGIETMEEAKTVLHARDLSLPHKEFKIGRKVIRAFV